MDRIKRMKSFFWKTWKKIIDKWWISTTDLISSPNMKSNSKCKNYSHSKSTFQEFFAIFHRTTSRLHNKSISKKKGNDDRDTEWLFCALLIVYLFNLNSSVRFNDIKFIDWFLFIVPCICAHSWSFTFFLFPF